MFLARARAQTARFRDERGNHEAATPLALSLNAFLSPEAALLLSRDLWKGSTPGSNTLSPRFTDFPSLRACSESNLFGWLSIRNHYSAHARKIGPSQFLPRGRDSWCWPKGEQPSEDGNALIECSTCELYFNSSRK